jgi:hypothetical protein
MEIEQNGNNFVLQLIRDIPLNELQTYEEKDLLMGNKTFIIFKNQI